MGKIILTISISFVVLFFVFTAEDIVKRKNQQLNTIYKEYSIHNTLSLYKSKVEISKIISLSKMQKNKNEDLVKFIALNLINIGAKNKEDIKINMTLILQAEHIEQTTKMKIIKLFLFSYYLSAIFILVYLIRSNIKKSQIIISSLILLIPGTLIFYLLYVVLYFKKTSSS